ncbi:MAG: hypothetical protein ACTSR5_11920 [Promethearchaeota archaeon]
MAVIITHPGSAHLDDFLSCCLVINKSGNVKKVNLETRCWGKV